jgi:hypothetical protein
MWSKSFITVSLDAKHSQDKGSSKESGSAINPGSCLNDEMAEFASKDTVMNDLLHIVLSRD